MTIEELKGELTGRVAFAQQQKIAAARSVDIWAGIEQEAQRTLANLNKEPEDDGSKED